jgi:protease-4
LSDIRSYVSSGRRPNDRGTRVALIYGVGSVQTEEAEFSPLGGDQVMASDTVAKAIRDAVEDDKVRAILIRIDSPGGSYIASDTIWRAIRQARERGKPVVASMGHLAASGGYFVAMAADRIVADPGTVTGSIGVFAGKLVLRDFWKKLGVDWDEVHVGANALANSTNQPFSDSAWKLLNRQLDRIYTDFTTKAGEARKLDAAAMDKVARGRIWIGADAQKMGLVDELGGFRTALGTVRQLVNLPADAPLELKLYPKPKGALAELIEALQNEQLPMADVFAGLARLGRVTAALDPLLGRLEGAQAGNELRAPTP